MTNLAIGYEREDDGRWIAIVDALPGCLVYGETRDEARRKVIALALEILADQVAHGERAGDFAGVRFADAA